MKLVLWLLIVALLGALAWLLVRAIVRATTDTEGAGDPGDAGEQPAQDVLTGAAFARRLDELGFLAYEEPARRAACLAALEKDWGGVFEVDSRLFHADAEHLAEGGVEDLLVDIDPFLRAQGVQLGGVTTSYEETAYRITVGGREFEIWNADDIARDRTDGGWLWGISSVRAFALVNRLLEEAGSPERAHAVYGGNEMALLFLTPPQHALFLANPAVGLRDRPYIPSAEDRAFGQAGY